MWYDDCKSAAVSIVGSKADSIHQRNEDHYQLLDNLNEHLEPNLAVSPVTAIYVVCDGFDGDRCAEFVSAELPGLIKECPHFESLDVPADEALLLSVLDAVEQVETMFMKNRDIMDDSGCSLTVCIIRGDLLCVAWVGTCQLAVASSREVIFVTEPHHPLENIDEHERIKNTHGENWTGEVSDDGKVMGMLGCTRAIGGTSFKEKFPGLIPSTPQVSIFEFCPETHGDAVIVLSTNKLSEFVSDNALIAIAKSAEDDHDSLHAVAVRIARAVRTKTKSSLKIECDLVLPSNDITVVVCKPSYHAQQITELHM